MNQKTQDKILFIMHYPPPIHGAAMVGQYIRQSTLINKAFDCKYINLSTSRSVDEIGQKGVVKWLRYLQIIATVIKTLWFYRPRVVYITLTAQGIGFYKDAIFVLLAKLHGKKVILHFHNKGVTLRKDYTFDNFLYRRVFKNTKVILLAEELFKDVEKYVSIEQVYFCPNGIPEISVNVLKEPKASDKVVLLFLSNLIISKGILVLLEACKILKQKGVAFQCNIVGGAGDLSEQDLIDHINDLGLKADVAYLDKKYGDEKAAVFSEASVFVLPTFYKNECFPLVLLEAMQYSLPLVSTSEGGIPSIIDDDENGYMISKKNNKHLAKTLEKLIKDEVLRKRLGANARHKYLTHYTLEKFELNFLSIMHKIF